MTLNPRKPLRHRGQLAGDSLDLCSKEPEVAQQSLGNMRVPDGLWRTRKLRDTTETLKAPQIAPRLARKARLSARPTGTESGTKGPRGTRKAGGIQRS